MPDANSYIQISTEIGLGALATVAVGIATTTWWFSRLIKGLGDNQTKMKEELTASQTQLKADLTASQVTLKADLTKSINDVDNSQAKRDNDLDRNVSAVQASLNSHTTLIEQKMNTLQAQMSDFAAQVKENRHDTNELRERVVRLETIAEKSGVPPERY